VKPDPFESFAERYDVMSQGDVAMTEFFRRLITRYGLRSVLDCACGTGNDVLLLDGLGIDATGADISDAMLEQARRKVSDRQKSIPLVKADFRELPAQFARRFDAVLCLGTSLPQLPDEREIVVALRSMREVLAPGGVLVISQGMTDRQYRERSRFIPIVNTQDFSRIMVIDYFETAWEVHVLDLSRSGADSQFVVEDFRYVLLLRDDYERLISEAGFAAVDFYGGFDLTPYDRQESNRVIAVARK
jgi:glycine/sarcosine N-methyltransferase